MNNNKCLLDSCTDLIVHSKTAVSAWVTAVTGVGLGTILGWLERGFGFAASFGGILVTIAIWRKMRAERRETELRIRILEKQLDE